MWTKTNLAEKVLRCFGLFGLFCFIWFTCLIDCTPDGLLRYWFQRINLSIRPISSIWWKNNTNNCFSKLRIPIPVYAEIQLMLASNPLQIHCRCFFLDIVHILTSTCSSLLNLSNLTAWSSSLMAKLHFTKLFKDLMEHLCKNISANPRLILRIKSPQIRAGLFFKGFGFSWN